MMDKTIEVVKSIISPEQVGQLHEKLQVYCCSSNWFIGFQQYTTLDEEIDTEIPIVEVYENDPKKQIKVEDLRQNLLGQIEILNQFTGGLD